MSGSTEVASIRSKSRALPGLASLLVLTAAYIPLRLMMDSPDVGAALYRGAYMYGTALQVLFAATVVVTAMKIGLGSSIGKQWLLIGLGVSVYALGDICWTLFELYLGIDPFPSIADLFYTLQYPLFLAALVLAIRSYSGLVETKNAIAAGGIVAVVGVTALYFLLLQPYIIPAGLDEVGGFWGKAVSILYPIGDVVFMLAPAVSLALIVRQLGKGRLAHPWWLVVVATVVFALADSFFVYTEWAGTGYVASLDLAYTTANMLFAAAALVAQDVFRGRSS